MKHFPCYVMILFWGQTWLASGLTLALHSGITHGSPWKNHMGYQKLNLGQLHSRLVLYAISPAQNYIFIPRTGCCFLISILLLGLWLVCNSDHLLRPANIFTLPIFLLDDRPRLNIQPVTMQLEIDLVLTYHIAFTLVSQWKNT